jgi:hypothetical protein
MCSSPNLPALVDKPQFTFPASLSADPNSQTYFETGEGHQILNIVSYNEQGDLLLTVISSDPHDIIGAVADKSVTGFPGGKPGTGDDVFSFLLCYLHGR